MAIEVDVDDSTELLYATLESNENIPEEALTAFLSNTLAGEIRRIYNQREEIAEQIEGQQQAAEAVDAE